MASKFRPPRALHIGVCGLIGASSIHLTPPGNEGGIDFYAKVRIPSHYGTGTKLDRLRIVGQAKMYNHPVTLGELREFNNSLGAVRRDSPEVAEHIPIWFREDSSAIVGWMVGHSGFQSGCYEKARTNGLMLYDSLSLSEMISLSHQVAPNEDGQWLAKQIRVRCDELLRQERVLRTAA